MSPAAAERPCWGLLLQLVHSLNVVWFAFVLLWPLQNLREEKLENTATWLSRHIYLSALPVFMLRKLFYCLFKHARPLGKTCSVPWKSKPAHQCKALPPESFHLHKYCVVLHNLTRNTPSWQAFERIRRWSPHNSTCFLPGNFFSLTTIWLSIPNSLCVTTTLPNGIWINVRSSTTPFFLPN